MLKYTDVEINNQLFDFVIDETHPIVSRALGYLTEEDLRNTLITAMTNGGLTYENLEEMNAGGSWCISTKAASLA